MTQKLADDISSTRANSDLLLVVVIAGLIASLLASSCYTIHLLMTVFDQYRPWLASIHQYLPLQPVFLAFAAVLLGYATHQIYWHGRDSRNAPGSRRVAAKLGAVRWMHLAGVMIFAATAAATLWFSVIGNA